MMALGLVETKGLLAAVEGADAMLKAADVRLLEKNLVGGGLVTITVAGEVSAVRASVDAAVAAIGRIKGSTLISERVIARPDVELTQILRLEPDDEAPEDPDPPVSGACREPETPDFSVSDTGTSDTGTPEASEARSAQNAEQPVRYGLAQLKNMSVTRLRHVAQTTGGLSLSGEKIASADKKSLIEAIVEAYRRHNGSV